MIIKFITFLIEIYVYNGIILFETIFTNEQN
jgi:hypothetical protein